MWIFNMRPLLLLLLVLSCIFKILFSPQLSQTCSRQTLSRLLSLIKLSIFAWRGYFCVCKLYFTEVIICHPILNVVKWTHKLQSLNSALLLRLILFCAKGQLAVDQVPATQIIQLPFMSFFKLRKNQLPGKLTVQYLTAVAPDMQRLLFMLSILRYP